MRTPLAKRFLCAALSLVLASAFVSASSPDAWAKTSAVSKKAKAAKSRKAAPQPDRSAALVVDVSSGKILYSQNAKAQRYPASLTKMMTLYLLFDALKRGEVRMEENLPVSAKAAAQPSTNLSMQAGDRIPVRKAIEGLVIRSANDAAMVVAEALGGTQWNFALLMNQKARELGMRNTVFRNPNGLPDAGQVTTALDMAKLGIALRRDFPEYYHFFAQDSFDFQGRTYTTHNRVLGRLPGADGLKTGYINASGYNVVTSVKRDGESLVGVVMGGRTAAARDNQMVAMMDRSLVQLAQAKAKGDVQTANAAILQQVAPQTMAALEPAAGEALQGEGDESAPPVATVPSKAKTAKAAPRKMEPSLANALWGVQVGVYSSKTQALSAAKQVKKEASLDAATASVDGLKAAKGRTLHRARLVGLTESQARGACQALQAKSRDCMVFKAARG